MSEFHLGENMWIVEVELAKLREADVNAHVMAKDKFAQLVANIRQRGKLESLPYCAQPKGEGAIEILSGHHRVKAAREAGILRAHVMVDRSTLTRSQMIAKQIAHNALVGLDDESILRQLVKMIDNVDDLLATGLPKELLPTAEDQKVTLYTPSADFRWHTVTFAFLPHQTENLKALLDALQGTQDVLCAACDGQWAEFLNKTAEYARIKNVRSASTAIAKLIAVAQAEIEAATPPAPEEDPEKPPGKVDSRAKKRGAAA
jgi:hypothetical protein